MPELLEVLRFQRERMKDTPPVEIGGKWYGDYPFREDKRLGVPRSIYQLEGELGLRAEIEALEWDGDKLQLRGNAYIRGIGAPAPDTQQVKVIAIRRGRLRRVRLRISGIRLPTTITRRPGRDRRLHAAAGRRDVVRVRGVARPEQAAYRRPLGAGVWEVYVVVRAGKVHRRRGSFLFSRLRPLRGVELPSPDGVVAKATPTGGGGIVLDVRTKWTTIHGHRLDGDVLELTGEAHGSGDGKARLELIRSGDEKTFKFPLKPVGAGEGSSVEVAARMKLSKLLDVVHTEDAEEDKPDDADEAEDRDEAEEAEDRQVWNVQAVSGGARHTVGLREDRTTTVWRGEDRVLELSRNRRGDAALIEQIPHPVVRRGIVDGRRSARARRAPAGGGPASRTSC